ncbi:MT-A70 family methyltransferase [Bosea sp. (in: a-proteobacteria)]|uniref:MT-A70 family methyltransferase n=1 Tax=Bosea sp. (in: a-proteobacteria) TaxID=1871050 RepID=UPI00260C4BBA|nr:MT-A70 family methyltransferase [Bosea sp. (in: a-proteobacteria)]MCO5091974.1 MT-A70 family methyltransferase [Bosea sp. (in: a-proteobacteria)]
MKELEFHPYANLFPLIEGPAFEDLVADIEANGIREPIVMFEGKILDGRNRYRAGRAAGVILDDMLPEGPNGFHYDPFRAFGGKHDGDPLAFVISANLHRRHLDETQRAMVASRLANLGHGGKRSGKVAPEQAANLPVAAEEPAPAPVTQAAAAKLLNVSERTVRSAKAVVEHGAPELVAKADAGAIAVSVAAELAKLPVDDQREVLRSADPGALYRVIKDQRDALTAQKKVKRAEKVKALATKQKALPAKKYGVIYADPEWDHETWSEAGKGRAAANHYPVSTTAVIKSRPVGEIAAPDGVLFLWVTVPHLAQGLDVMAAWGFAYKSSCVWEKVYPGKQQGMGYWFRVNHEILLVGTRGDIPAPALGTQWPSVIKAPVGEHSEKPEQFAELIEAYFGDLPKIELNARKARPGWDVWGLEAPEAEEPAAPAAKPARGRAKKSSAHDYEVEKARREARIKARLDVLPDDLDALIDAYRAAIDSYDFAMNALDRDEAKTHRETMDAIILKANGGGHFGSACNPRPMAVRAAGIAPLGTLPRWGESGHFIVEHRDIRAIVEIDHNGGTAIYALDFNRLFPSETGFHSLLGECREAGETMEAFGCRLIDAAIAYSEQSRGKTKALMLPEQAYRLQLGDGGHPIWRERGVWVDPDAPPLGLDLGLIEGLGVIRARWEQEDRAKYLGLKSKGGKRTCPESRHRNDKIIAVNGQMLTPVADFPTEGAYVVTDFKWVDGNRVEGWRFVDEAAFLDREPEPAPAPSDDDPADIPAFLQRDPDTADMFEEEGA